MEKEPSITASKEEGGLLDLDDPCISSEQNSINLINRASESEFCMEEREFTENKESQECNKRNINQEDNQNKQENTLEFEVKDESKFYDIDNRKVWEPEVKMEEEDNTEEDPVIDKLKIENNLKNELIEETDNYKVVKDSTNKKCQYCGKEFKDRQKLGFHILTHTGEKPFICDFCQEPFRNPSGLKRHMLLHKEKTVACYHCPKMFSDERLLHLHLKYLEDKFSCTICNQTFKRKENLKVHMRLHTGETPFNCDKCDAKFHLNEKLKEHYVQFHDAPKRCFICETCGKEYSRRTEMLEHSKVHDKDPEFKCEVCGKAFFTRKKYIGHMNIHNQIYECKECTKYFDSQRNLQRHEKCHLSIKDYQCDMCAKAYKSKRSLEQHMEIKHQVTTGKNQRFGCDQCEKSYTRPEFLKRHVLKHLDT